MRSFSSLWPLRKCSSTTVCDWSISRHRWRIHWIIQCCWSTCENDMKSSYQKSHCLTFAQTYVRLSMNRHNYAEFIFFSYTLSRTHIHTNALILSFSKSFDKSVATNQWENQLVRYWILSQKITLQFGWMLKALWRCLFNEILREKKKINFIWFCRLKTKRNM